MKYIDIQKQLEKLKIFSTQDLKILDNKFFASKISKWKKAWYIKQIIRWYYLLSKIDVDNGLLFRISNTIYNPSYISLESVFSYYWIIPEYTFTITNVSTKKTNTFHTDIWNFDYKKIKSSLYFGYKIKTIKDNKVLIASLEKAIIDYFYLYNNINSIIDFEFLRWNKEILKEKLDIDKLKEYWKFSKTVSKRINLLINYINND